MGRGLGGHLHDDGVADAVGDGDRCVLVCGKAGPAHAHAVGVENVDALARRKLVAAVGKRRADDVAGAFAVNLEVGKHALGALDPEALLVEAR